MIRILLVDDEEIFRRLLGKAFADDPDCQIVYSAESLEEAAAFQGEYDCCILDLNLTATYGMETTRRAIAIPLGPMVVLTGLEDVELSKTVIKEGAKDYLVKDILREKNGIEVLKKSIHYATARDCLAVLADEIEKAAKKLERHDANPAKS